VRLLANAGQRALTRPVAWAVEVYLHVGGHPLATLLSLIRKNLFVFKLTYRKFVFPQVKLRRAGNKVACARQQTASP
jgi:hypothetical protein